MESSLSPVVGNIFMEHSEKLALEAAEQKPSLWLRYFEIHVHVRFGLMVWTV
jgi:hypothetical protein